jgi:hypothetical protein
MVNVDSTISQGALDYYRVYITMGPFIREASVSLWIELEECKVT